MIADVNATPLGPLQGSAAFEETDLGAVVAGCLVVFDSSVSDLHRTDVMKSLLFAQLAASAKAKRHTQWKEWYRQYHSVLQAIGWALGAAFAATRWESSTSFVLDQPVLDAFGDRSGTDARISVSKAVTVLRKDIGGRVQEMFDSAGRSGSLGNFQVALVTEDDDAEVRLRIGEFCYQSTSHVDSLASGQFPVTTRLYAGFFDLTLNEEVFSAGRRTIAHRLGDRYERQVALLREARLPEPEPREPTLDDTQDPSDPFGDALDEGYRLTSVAADGLVLATYQPPPVIDSLLLDEPGNRILLSEERTVEPHYFFVVLEAPSQIYITSKSIKIWTVRVPPGQDPLQFATNVQFLVKRTQVGESRHRFLVDEVRSYATSASDTSFGTPATRLRNPNAQIVGSIETRGQFKQATFRVDRQTLEGNELHLEFYKSGLFGAGMFGRPSMMPIEFRVRGSLGMLYRFKWESL